jgi:hypothetical protein
MTFEGLRALSFFSSAVYVALLTTWIAPGAENVKYWLGWTHGITWIVLSLLSLDAVRRRILPFWLAVVVVVLGGLGPFLGTAGFVVQSRRIRST